MSAQTAEVLTALAAINDSLRADAQAGFGGQSRDDTRTSVYAAITRLSNSIAPDKLLSAGPDPVVTDKGDNINAN